MFRLKKPSRPALEEVRYVRVPKEVCVHPSWKTDAQAMHTLVLLHDLGENWEFDNRAHLATLLGKNDRTLERHYKTLAALGLIRWSATTLELWPFRDGSELPEAEVVQAEPVAAPVVQERIAAEPKPKTAVRLPKGEREARIMAAWNDNLPSGWKEVKEVPLPVKCAIDYHMKECGITSGEYDKFIPAVLRMAEHVKQPAVGQVEIGWVFGWDKSPAKPLDQWKVDQIKDLYNAGKKVKTHRRVDSVTWGDDQQVLSLFAGKPYRGVQFKRVDRIRIEEDQEVMLFAALNYLQFNDEYTVEQAKVKIAQAGVEWRDIWAEPGTLVLLYRKDASKIPFNWSLHETPSLFLNP
jgi:hypothetical protein